MESLSSRWPQFWRQIKNHRIIAAVGGLGGIGVVTGLFHWLMDINDAAHMVKTYGPSLLAFLNKYFLPILLVMIPLLFWSGVRQIKKEEEKTREAQKDHRAKELNEVRKLLKQATTLPSLMSEKVIKDSSNKELGQLRSHLEKLRDEMQHKFSEMSKHDQETGYTNIDTQNLVNVSREFVEKLNDANAQYEDLKADVPNVLDGSSIIKWNTPPPGAVPARLFMLPRENKSFMDELSSLCGIANKATARLSEFHRNEMKKLKQIEKRIHSEANKH